MQSCSSCRARVDAQGAIGNAAGRVLRRRGKRATDERSGAWPVPHPLSPDAHQPASCTATRAVAYRHSAHTCAPARDPCGPVPARPPTRSTSTSSPTAPRPAGARRRAGQCVTSLSELGALHGLFIPLDGRARTAKHYLAPRRRGRHARLELRRTVPPLEQLSRLRRRNADAPPLRRRRVHLFPSRFRLRPPRPPSLHEREPSPTPARSTATSPTRHGDKPQPHTRTGAIDLPLPHPT